MNQTKIKELKERIAKTDNVMVKAVLMHEIKRLEIDNKNDPNVAMAKRFWDNINTKYAEQTIEEAPAKKTRKKKDTE